MTARDWWNLIRGVPTEAGRPLPEGFVHPQQDPSYAMGGFEPKYGAKLVGQAGCVGARYRMGPFDIETYFSDQEPSISPAGRHRLVVWQPITQLDVPKGWWRFPAGLNARQHGVVGLGNRGRELGTGEYWKDWSGHAQRHRRKWLRDGAHEIAEADPDAYVAAYRASGRLPLLREDFVGIIRRRRLSHGKDMRLLVAREKATGRIVAGLGVLDLPGIKTSMHVTAFISPGAERTSAGHGLIDAWFRQSLERGLKFLHLGLVWYPGDPLGWRGYSRFKRQFAPTLIVYPTALVKIVKKARP